LTLSLLSLRMMALVQRTAESEAGSAQRSQDHPLGMPSRAPPNLFSLTMDVLST
jgi:hypothetical protein